MRLKFSLKACSIRVPGISCPKELINYSLGSFAELFLSSDPASIKCSYLPKMQARRLKLGSRAAADVASELLKHNPKFCVFSSRHGELERCYNILYALSKHEDTSPTDFAMSVHNAAAGSFTIVNKAKIPCSSVSSEQDTFFQGLTEAVSAFADHDKVLFVAFNGKIPQIFPSKFDCSFDVPYAAGFVLGPGSQFTLEEVDPLDDEDVLLPLSLQFAYGLLNNKKHFTFHAHKRNFLLSRTS